MAEMARRDLDAALQLLADRAQYITGASGAAIALRRNGKNDMLCRASTGSNAPELGTLLSTEFGLSGESVRTRQPLRCDDAERDARVNREVCRQLGIASVVVMPVVNDDEVLGVFELFSGKVNAFGERDVSAVQRLSEMVETAVRLGEAAENLPEQLRMTEISAVVVGDAEAPQDQILEGKELDDQVLDDSVFEVQGPVVEVAAGKIAEELGTGASGAEVLMEEEGANAELEAPRNPKADLLTNGDAAAPEPLKAKIPTLSQKAQEGAPIEGPIAAAPAPPKAIVVENNAAAPQAVAPQAAASPVPSADTTRPNKQLFWSAALNPAADVGRPEEADQSHVPPVLRSLRKCEACGFPVSAGRVLCVECEEKKWRGQLKVPQVGAPRQVAIPASVTAVPKSEARAFAAAAQSVAAGVPIPSPRGTSATEASTAGVQTSLPMKESKEVAGQAVAVAPAANPSVRVPVAEPATETSGTSSPDFVLSAGLEPSQSWLSANKYIIGVLLVVGVVVVTIFLLR